MNKKPRDDDDEDEEQIFQLHNRFSSFLLKFILLFFLKLLSLSIFILYQVQHILMNLKCVFQCVFRVVVVCKRETHKSKNRERERE